MNEFTFTETFTSARMFCRIPPGSHLLPRFRFALSLATIVHMICALECIASVSQFDLCLPRPEENCREEKLLSFISRKFRRFGNESAEKRELSLSPSSLLARWLWFSLSSKMKKLKKYSEMASREPRKSTHKIKINYHPSDGCLVSSRVLIYQ